MGTTRLAEKYFEIATTAMREFGDHALAATVYAHWSFVPGFAGDGASARPLLDAAHSLELAAQAFEQLEHKPYGTAYGRIPTVRRALDGTPQARVLDERVRSLPAGR